MDIESRKKLIDFAKKQLEELTPRDVLIIQSIHTIDELIKTINRLVTNLRERYGYYASKSSKIENIDLFLREVKKNKREPAGIEFKKQDLDSVNELVKEIENLIILNKSQEEYLDIIMKEQCPELLKVAGALIGARLISIAGSLKHLAELPSSTVQILGSEKALFRHIKTGSKPPKFGIIFAHQEIQTANENERAKVARKLAAKISIAVKKDYFRK